MFFPLFSNATLKVTLVRVWLGFMYTMEGKSREKALLSEDEEAPLRGRGKSWHQGHREKCLCDEMAEVSEAVVIM